MAKRNYYSDKDVDCFLKDVDWAKKLKSRITNVTDVKDKYNRYTFFSGVVSESIYYNESNEKGLSLLDIVKKLELVDYKYSSSDFVLMATSNDEEDSLSMILNVFNFLINDKKLNILSAKEAVIASCERNKSLIFSDGLKKLGIDIEYKTLKNIVSMNTDDDIVDMMTLDMGTESMLNSFMSMTGQSSGMFADGDELEDFGGLFNEGEGNSSAKTVHEIVDYVKTGSKNIKALTIEVVDIIKNKVLSEDKLLELLNSVFPRQHRTELYLYKNPQLDLNIFNFREWLVNQENKPKELYSEMQLAIINVIKEKISVLKLTSDKPKIKVM